MRVRQLRDDSRGQTKLSGHCRPKDNNIAHLELLLRCLLSAGLAHALPRRGSGRNGNHPVACRLGGRHRRCRGGAHAGRQRDGRGQRAELQWFELQQPPGQRSSREVRAVHLAARGGRGRARRAVPWGQVIPRREKRSTMWRLRFQGDIARGLCYVPDARDLRLLGGVVPPGMLGYGARTGLLRPAPLRLPGSSSQDLTRELPRASCLPPAEDDHGAASVELQQLLLFAPRRRRHLFRDRARKARPSGGTAGFGAVRGCHGRRRRRRRCRRRRHRHRHRHRRRLAPCMRHGQQHAAGGREPHAVTSAHALQACTARGRALRAPSGRSAGGHACSPASRKPCHILGLLRSDLS
mmetsp:Transcript_35623/g.115479  ORF Transcript_35623/g.115479 Transcript_35623/m.115479 type:complete len:352 (+) Transcript_35623:960-2015(+)